MGRPLVIAVDTNVVSLYFRNKNSLHTQDELYIPYIVVAELEAGVLAGSNPTKNMLTLKTFYDNPNVTISPGLMPEVIKSYVQIYAYLRSCGTPISPNDLWIAAECMSLAMPLLTYDKDFQHVPQIILV